MQGLSYDLIPSVCHVFQVEWNFSVKFDVPFFDVNLLVCLSLMALLSMNSYSW